MYGERLRELRRGEGLTQKQLAEKLNISQKSLSKYECESLDLNTELIIKICRFFQVSADYHPGPDVY